MQQSELDHTNSGDEFAALCLPGFFHVEYAISGQPALLHASAVGGTVTRLSDEQLPLGLLPGSAYRSHRISVQPDDVLLVATDGNLEAEDRNGVAFGTERLERLFLDNVSVPLPALAARLQSAVQSTYQQSDDQTLLLIRFRA